MTNMAASRDASDAPLAACECRRTAEVVSRRIPAYMGGHLAPICRLSATETEWYCLYTLIHWVWYEDASAQEILHRIDPVTLLPLAF